MTPKNIKRKGTAKLIALALVLILIFAGIVIVMASPTPTLQFIYPTPANNSYQTADFAEINISINESYLNEFKFNWNGTNYTFYNDSLVLGMNFNNNSEIGENSTYAVDISKYGNNGTINGAVWNSSGKFGSALSFDGVDDYVDCGSDASLNITDKITIEAWVNPSADGWKYKRPITLSPATSQGNYQVKVELTTSNFDYSKAKTNGEDLRFYQADGTSLDYWIETWNTSGTSTIWVEVATSGTDTIYMYYGNPSASSASNGTSTFIFFDDFDNYTVNWQTGGDSPSVSSETVDGRSVVKITDGGTNSGGIWTKNNVDVENKIIERMVKGWGSSGADVDEFLGVDNSWASEWYPTTNLGDCLMDLISGDSHGLYIGGSGDYNLGSKHLKDTWDIAKTIIETGKITGIYDGEELSRTGTPSTYNAKLILSTDNNANSAGTYYDWIRVRKYASPEPTATIGDETAAGISKAGSYGIGANTTTAFASINNQTISGAISSGWNHIALTYDKDVGGTDEMKLFMNGIQKATGDYSTPISTNTNNLLIGDYFNGTIDEVRIYNRALSAEEIKMHYLSEFQKYNQTHWYFYDNVTDLPEKTHTYYGYANDTAGNAGQTETRTLTRDVTTPTITIDTPTETSPVYKKSGEQFWVNFTYTEENPKNYTVTINSSAVINSTHDTCYTPNSYKNVSFNLNSTAADGWYNVSVEMG